MKKFEIRDWANNLKFDGKTFDSFEEGWEFLYEQFPVTDEEPEDETLQEFFVVEVA